MTAHAVPVPRAAPQSDVRSPPGRKRDVGPPFVGVPGGNGEAGKHPPPQLQRKSRPDVAIPREEILGDAVVSRAPAAMEVTADIADGSVLQNLVAPVTGFGTGANPDSGRG